MLGIDLVETFRNIPPEAAVMAISALPISELRGAIPAGIGVWNLPWWEVYVLAVIGNVVPVVLILALIEPIAKFLRARSVFFERFFSWLFERTRKKFYDHHQKWGSIGLVIFVAIPLPMTGAWTGALAAWLFGMHFWKGLLLVALGVIIAASVVTALSLGIFSLF